MKRIEELTIQHDASGQGHAWRTVDADDLPAHILEEIRTEAIDVGFAPGEYVATNGQHYRWLEN